MPQPIPSPLPKWAKTLLRIQAWVVPSFATDLVEFEGVMGSVLADTSNEWRRFVFSFQPTGSTDTADTAYTTMDIVNITGGLVDNSWTDADYTSVANELNKITSYYTSSVMSSAAVWTGYRAYKMAFTELPAVPPTPPDRDHPFAPSGPPEKIAPASVPGQPAGIPPPQVAISVTEKTPYPRHWGRMYWPFPGYILPGLNSDMQLSNTQVDGLANAVHSCYDGLMTKEFFPVVPVTQANKQPARGLLTVSEIQVDSNVDVVRRRRAHKTRYRKTLSI